MIMQVFLLFSRIIDLFHVFVREQEFTQTVYLCPYYLVRSCKYLKGGTANFNFNKQISIFVSDLKKEWERLGNPKTRGVTGNMYSYMVTKYAVPAVNDLYGGRAVWQDYPATIHRTEAALEACSVFGSRIPHEEQAVKMADVWPVENVWAIVKDRVKAKEPKNKAQLKRFITNVWKDIDMDKGLCKRLMQSIPARLEAVIAKEGRQVRKKTMREEGKSNCQSILCSN